MQIPISTLVLYPHSSKCYDDLLLRLRCCAGRQLPRSARIPQRSFRTLDRNPLNRSNWRRFHNYRSYKVSQPHSRSIEAILIESSPAIPFQLTPTAAAHSLETAAASALGLKGILSLMLSRVLGHFGVEIDPGIERIAFRPLLLPCWRVDISLQGVGTLASGNSVELICA